jgi:hypothetical protein
MKQQLQATPWASETFGMGDWCPQSAQEFIDFCNGCRWEIGDVRHDSSGIWVQSETNYHIGYAPTRIDGYALVAKPA